MTATDCEEPLLVIQPPPIQRPSVTGSKAEARLLREAECFVLASHFFWGLWAIVNAPVSKIPFGYWVKN